MADVYGHGVYGRETATAIVPPTRVDTALSVVVGTAPVHLSKDPIGTNKPLLVTSYSEAITRIGNSKNWADYTLSEVVYSQFALFQVYPAVFINVLDPKKHKKTVTNEALALTDNMALSISRYS